MMGCSVDPANKSVRVEQEIVIDNNKCGILASHAYAILDVFEIPKPDSKKKRKTSRLIRIRNPWGQKEWTGKWCDDSDEINENQERIQEKLNQKYEGTHEKIYVNQNDGCFLMCFSDFLRVFNKLYICANFPPNYVGVRAIGRWEKGIESGGLPIHNSQAEFEAFPTNPQYSLTISEETKVFISLLQNDGRLTGEKYPFAKSVLKTCLIICKTRGKERVQDCGAIMDKTAISQRKDISMEITLKKGDYVIMPCPMEGGSVGEYCLEIFMEDEYVKDDNRRPEDPIQFEKNSFEKLEGIKCKYELVSEGTANQITTASNEKKKFMMAQFKNCIGDEDTIKYVEVNAEEEEERDEYDYL